MPTNRNEELSPKKVRDILSDLAKSDLAGIDSSKKADNSMKILKAHCLRFKEKNISINNTVFSFDKDGYCKAKDVGNTKLDFILLCKKNGVVEVVDEAEVADPAIELLVEEDNIEKNELLDTEEEYVLDEEDDFFDEEDDSFEDDEEEFEDL